MMNSFTFEAGHLITFAFVITIQKPFFIFRSGTLLILLVSVAGSSEHTGCCQYPDQSVRYDDSRFWMSELENEKSEIRTKD